jgi:hypothetical protein
MLIFKRRGRKRQQHNLYIQQSGQIFAKTTDTENYETTFGYDMLNRLVYYIDEVGEYFSTT